VDALEAAAAAAGIPVHPAPATLRLIQDKLAQKRFFAERGVALGDFVGVASEAELAGAIEVRLLRARARTHRACRGRSSRAALTPRPLTRPLSSLAPPHRARRPLASRSC
jgi:hypothetical protein